MRLSERKNRSSIFLRSYVAFHVFDSFLTLWFSRTASPAYRDDVDKESYNILADSMLCSYSIAKPAHIVERLGERKGSTNLSKLQRKDPEEKEREMRENLLE